MAGPLIKSNLVMTPKNIHKVSYPPKMLIKTRKNIEIQNFEPPKMTRAYVCMKMFENTPPPPVVLYFIPFNLICNMTIFEEKKILTGSEAKVTVTPKYYATLCDLITHTYTHTHAKFGIPTSNNIGNILRTRLF